MSATVICVMSGARAALLRRGLGPDWRVAAVTPAAPGLTTAAATAATAQALRRAVRPADAAEACVIWPRLAAPLRSRNPPLSVWRRRRHAVVRASYLAARAAGLSLQARGGGRLLLVIDPLAADDLVGAVLSESLQVLADALRKALRPEVEVSLIIGAGPAAGARWLASGRVDAQIAHQVRDTLVSAAAHIAIVGAPRRTPG